MTRFEGFPPSGLRFLRDLAKHNDRAWFAPRKHIYERDVLQPMQSLVTELSDRFERKRIPVYGDVRRSIFRIYRDVRFSNNKLPYKTHAAAYLSPDGGRHTPGGLYIHVAPKGAFLSLAFYDLHPMLLQRWRVAMAEEPKAFATVIRKLARAKLHLIPPDEEEDSLRRMPRGFTHLTGTELGSYFRLRHFLIHDDVEAATLGSRRLLERSVTFVERGLPLLSYGWRLAAELMSG
ncbi:MAG: DUF2461 domain-containing protein [Vulcanimicrobiaceae bacterium]